jgi:LysR family transcriptional regulator, cys regulon transcriptional activator
LSLLAPALGEFQKAQPSTRVHVVNALKPAVIESVRSGEADLGLTSAALIPDDLFYEEVISNALELLAPADHPLATRRAIKLADIEPHPLLLPDVHSSTRRLIEEAFRREEIKLKPGMELQRWEVIREFVAMGLGVAIVPSFVSANLAGVVRIGLAYPFPRRSYGILTSRARHISSPSRNLIASISGAARPAA